MNQTFSQWVLEQMKSRDWSQAELARQSGLSRTAISDVISGKTDPGYHLCVSIGGALELPSENVMRVAGLLPPYPDIDEDIERILEDVAKLPKRDQKEVLAFIRMKRRLREKGGK